MKVVAGKAGESSGLVDGAADGVAVSPAVRSAVLLGTVAIVAIALGVNMAGVMAIDPLAGVMIESEVQSVIDAVTGHAAARFLNQVFPFLLVMALLVAYLYPLFRFYVRPSRRPEEIMTLAHRLLGAPTIVAAMTGLGWLIGSPVVLVGARALGLEYDDRLFRQYIPHSMVLFGFSFVLGYYGVEAVVQRWIIPRLFSGNQLLLARSRFALSVRARLAVLAGTAGGLPGLFLLSAVGILNRGGDNATGIDYMVPVSLTLLIMAFLFVMIVWLKSLSIEAPITELTGAAGRLGRGDMRAGVVVRSVDRIGELAGAFNEMAAGLAERERERAVFGRTVDPRVRDRLLAAPGKKNGELRVSSVVFFDLAGFTAFSEYLPPRVVVSILNGYFQTVSACVEAEGGLVNKFIGDGVLAVFGAPEHQTDHARRALRAILAMGPRMERLNGKLCAWGYRPLRVRIGAHTGEVMAGIIGSKTRQEYTVIGDAVNIASRLESMGKEVGMDAVVSEHFWKASGRDASWTQLGTTTIRGRNESMTILGRTFGVRQ